MASSNTTEPAMGPPMGSMSTESPMGLERLSRLPKKNDLITQANEIIHTVALEGSNERLIQSNVITQSPSVALDYTEPIVFHAVLKNV